MEWFIPLHLCLKTLANRRGNTDAFFKHMLKNAGIPETTKIAINKSNLLQKINSICQGLELPREKFLKYFVQKMRINEVNEEISRRELEHELNEPKANKSERKRVLTDNLIKLLHKQLELRKLSPEKSKKVQDVNSKTHAIHSNRAETTIDVAKDILSHDTLPPKPSVNVTADPLTPILNLEENLLKLQERIDKQDEILNSKLCFDDKKHQEPLKQSCADKIFETLNLQQTSLENLHGISESGIKERRKIHEKMVLKKNRRYVTKTKSARAVVFGFIAQQVMKESINF